MKQRRPGLRAMAYRMRRLARRSSSIGRLTGRVTCGASPGRACCLYRVSALGSLCRQETRLHVDPRVMTDRLWSRRTVWDMLSPAGCGAIATIGGANVNSVERVGGLIARLSEFAPSSPVGAYSRSWRAFASHLAAFGKIVRSSSSHQEYVCKNPRKSRKPRELKAPGVFCCQYSPCSSVDIQRWKGKNSWGYSPLCKAVFPKWP